MPFDEKPSRNEDEFFVKQDAELIRQHRARLNEERSKLERAAHLNKCPKCGSELRERDYHHVKLDECPECGGLWLDKGELQMLEHVDRNSVSRFVGSMFGLK